MPKLRIYSSPRACSTASHIALEESGLDYDWEIVRIRKGEHRSDRFLAINPAGKLPVLQVDDRVLTESTAILTLIADLAAPDVRLLPDDSFARYRALEWMGFLTAAVHLSFRPLFRPQQFTDDEAQYAAIRERGGRHLRDTLLEVERRLDGRAWALGEDFSVVDPYLLVFHVWSQRDDIRPHVAGMPNWARHREAMMQREATARILEREGITADNITDP
ncbi:MAG: glutathione S-transferase N-terminal domain-containing protein [Woeseiaceae bacterium]|nr:glutathione S-transferase N-terminal domain-containing protein [Woeseiaceae bacterium]